MTLEERGAVSTAWFEDQDRKDNAGILWAISGTPDEDEIGELLGDDWHAFMERDRSEPGRSPKRGT